MQWKVVFDDGIEVSAEAKDPTSALAAAIEKLADLPEGAKRPHQGTYTVRSSQGNIVHAVAADWPS